jgi:hypothetical protein
VQLCHRIRDAGVELMSLRHIVEDTDEVG